MPAIYLQETGHPIGFTREFFQFVGDEVRFATIEGAARRMRFLRPDALQPGAEARAAPVRTVRFMSPQRAWRDGEPWWWALPTYGAPLYCVDHENALVISGDQFPDSGFRSLTQFIEACIHIVQCLPTRHSHVPLSPDIYLQSFGAWNDHVNDRPINRPDAWMDTMSVEDMLATRNPIVPPERALGTALAGMDFGSLERTVMAQYSMDPRSLSEIFLSGITPEPSRIADAFRDAYQGIDRAHAVVASRVAADDPVSQDEDDAAEINKATRRFEKAFPDIEIVSVDLQSLCGSITEMFEDNPEDYPRVRDVLRHLGTVLHEIADAAGVEDLTDEQLSAVVLNRIVDLEEDAADPARKFRGRRVELDEDF